VERIAEVLRPEFGTDAGSNFKILYERRS